MHPRTSIMVVLQVSGLRVPVFAISYIMLRPALHARQCITPLGMHPRTSIMVVLQVNGLEDAVLTLLTPISQFPWDPWDPYRM